MLSINKYTTRLRMGGDSMFKRLSILVLVVLAGFALFANAAFAQFNDVDPEHWAYDAVEYLADEGFVTGYPDGTFKGDQTMTRYEFAMVISRLYDQFLDMLDDVDNDDVEIDIEAILDMLMDEFQPEIDELYEIVAGNTARIDTLEGTVGGFDGRIADVEGLVDDMQAKFSPYGDLTMRFYGNYPEGSLQSQRPQFMLRFGFNSQINDELTLGARFTSGAENSRQSGYETYNDAFGFDAVNLDRAYLMWQPEMYDGFTMWAGKFAPPWVTTPMVWDGDIQVEGLAQHMAWENFDFYLGEMIPSDMGFYLLAQAAVHDLFIDDSTLAVTYHYINDDAWAGIFTDMGCGNLPCNWNR